jgi:DtxR family Mn-dependent transcriptional regulator
MKSQKIQHTHDHELTHSMVHYLLAIHKLKDLNGYARVTDIAKYLNLTKGSVSTALSNLKKKKLVVEDDARFLSLSDLGHAEVHSVLTTRTLLYYFFKDVLGLSEEVSHKDSCLMEHLMSDETRDKLFTFLQNQKLSFNLKDYKSFNDFLEDQKGDTYL